MGRPWLEPLIHPSIHPVTHSLNACWLCYAGQVLGPERQETALPAEELKVREEGQPGKQIPEQCAVCPRTNSGSPKLGVILQPGKEASHGWDLKEKKKFIRWQSEGTWFLWKEGAAPAEKPGPEIGSTRTEPQAAPQGEECRLWVHPGATTSSGFIRTLDKSQHLVVCISTCTWASPGASKVKTDAWLQCQTNYSRIS